MASSAIKTGRLPDFIIIGAAKSGTSSLVQYLMRHPQIFMSANKEPEYYSRDAVYAQGIDWYRGLFAAARDDQICGEGSTTYSRWPHTPDVPERIERDIPGAKFVYIMRHPVARTYSHYAHHMRTGVTMTFEQALERDAIYVDCSRYIRQIERYLQRFDRERFLFLFQHDLKNDPRSILDRTQKHLAVKPCDLMAGGEASFNVGGPDHYLRNRTTKRLRRVKPISWLADRMPAGVKDAAFSLLKRSFIGRRIEAENQIPPMKEETRRRLLDLFADETAQLERFLDVELPAWKK